MITITSKPSKEQKLLHTCFKQTKIFEVSLQIAEPIHQNYRKKCITEKNWYDPSAQQFVIKLLRVAGILTGIGFILGIQMWNIFHKNGKYVSAQTYFKINLLWLIRITTTAVTFPDLKFPRVTIKKS